MNALFILIPALVLYCSATAFVVREVRSQNIEIPYGNLIEGFSLITAHAAGIAIAIIFIIGIVFL